MELETWLLQRIRELGLAQAADLYWNMPAELGDLAVAHWTVRRRVVAKEMQRMRRAGLVVHEYVGQALGWRVIDRP